MSTAKKIIGIAAESVAEFVKDSAQQVAETVDPVKMMESTLGINRNESEFTKYLKGLGNNLTEADMEKRKKEFEDQKAKEIEEAKRVIRQSLPEHLRPSQALEPSEFEKNSREEEMKKAQIVETQKAQQQKAMIVPQGQQKGAGKKRKSSQSSSFEASKNIKIG